jgi:hypothetical protein
MIYFFIGLAIGIASTAALFAARIVEQARAIHALESENQMLAKQLGTLRAREMQSRLNDE